MEGPLSHQKKYVKKSIQLTFRHTAQPFEQMIQTVMYCAPMMGSTRVRCLAASGGTVAENTASCPGIAIATLPCASTSSTLAPGTLGRPVGPVVSGGTPPLALSASSTVSLLADTRSV